MATKQKRGTMPESKKQYVRDRVLKYLQNCNGKYLTTYEIYARMENLDYPLYNLGRLLGGMYRRNTLYRTLKHGQIAYSAKNMPHTETEPEEINELNNNQQESPPIGNTKKKITVNLPGGITITIEE